MYIKAFVCIKDGVVLKICEWMLLVVYICLHISGMVSVIVNI